MTLPVESLFGVQIAAQDLVLAGMRTLEGRLADEFLAREQRGEQAAAVSGAVRAALFEIVGRRQTESVVEDVRAQAAAAKDRHLAPPEVVEDIRRIFVS